MQKNENNSYSKPVIEQVLPGVGYLKPDGKQDAIYDRHYFHKYRKYSTTVRSELLTEFRFHFVRAAVNRLHSVMKDSFGRKIVDVGPGCHQFMEYVNAQSGWHCDAVDVGHGKEILGIVERDAEKSTLVYDVMTMWDSFEHITEPGALFERFHTPIVCMTLPVYESLDAARFSKHFRPNEHVWYHTDDGVVRHMQSFHYQKIFDSADPGEERMGREEVRSYAFAPSALMLRNNPNMSLDRTYGAY